jgi:hypothetical protein
MSEILADSEGQFQGNYNRASFMFRHGLKGHALFELGSLVELARRMPDHRETYWSNGEVDVADRWETSRDARLSPEDTIAHIADNHSLVILKHTEQDPVYGPLFQDFLAKVIDLSGEEMRREVAVGEVLILISSPNRLTPYHVDAECNFLVQVVGDKTLSVFDQTDRTLVSDDVVERYHAGDFSSAGYQEDRQSEAKVYDLRAGSGVHIPVFAPHWVRNHDNISVALSVNYELHPIRRQERICKLNSRLRKMGFAPPPPGISPWRDGIKLAAASSLIAAHRQLNRKSSEAYPVWTPSSL